MTGVAPGDDARTCRECNERVQPGDRLVRVEHGEHTPYGLAPADAAGYFHADCLPALPPAVAAGDDADVDAGGGG